MSDIIIRIMFTIGIVFLAIGITVIPWGVQLFFDILRVSMYSIVIALITVIWSDQ